MKTHFLCQTSPNPARCSEKWVCGVVVSAMEWGGGGDVRAARRVLLMLSAGEGEVLMRAEGRGGGVVGVIHARPARPTRQRRAHRVARESRRAGGCLKRCP